jgi:hypothetical protein
MKNLAFLVLLVMTVSCKPEPKKQLKYADVDTTSNAVVHLTDADDYYYSLTDLLVINKGKIIYINFFNSITPTDFMRGAESLDKKFSPDDFVILNISTDKAMFTFQDHLSITTMKHNYLARNFPQADFYTTTRFQQIPHYMIYDRDGTLLDNSALNPTNPNLKPTVQTLINQK